MADIAIACEEVWKSYRIYHQRSHTLKERLVARRSRYDDFWALKGVNLDVAAGSTLGLIGANGSGKSTLLKTMARILTPNRGSMRVKGTVSSLLELGIGFHPDLTGRENVYLGGSLLGLTRRDIDARYDDIVEFAGIEPFMDAPVKNYSTGMYARLAFSTAVSVDPEILLIDEVLSVGDQSFQMRCYERIAEFRNDGRTIVLVSHSLETIRSLCSQAVLIHEGVVTQAGQPHDVVAEYLTQVYAESEHQQEGALGPDRFGTGEAEITDVCFFNGEGNSVGVFRTGDTMTIRVSYRFKQELEDSSCGIAVYRAESLAYLFGHNSREAGVPIGPAGDGTLEYTVPGLPLMAGSYLVTVALHDTAKRIYDYRDRAYSFLVFERPGSPVEEGMVRVPSRWSVGPSRISV